MLCMLWGIDGSVGSGQVSRIADCGRIKYSFVAEWQKVKGGVRVYKVECLSRVFN